MGGDLADDWAASDDVKSSKPAPDLLQVSLKEAGQAARHVECVDR